MPGETESRSEGPLTSEAIKQFITSAGGLQQAVEKLLVDNRKYRRRMRGDKNVNIDYSETHRQDIADLQDQIRTLREKQIPEGHVTLPKADADALVEYKKLGEPKVVEEITKKKVELEATIAQRDKDAQYEAAAKKVNFKPSVLTKLAKSENFIVEERDVTEDGETKKVPFARTASDDKAEWLPLVKFVEKNLKDFLPSLREDAGNGGGKTGSAVTGREFPRQTSSEGNAPKKDVVGTYTERTYVTPSKLREQQKQS